MPQLDLIAAFDNRSCLPNECLQCLDFALQFLEIPSYTERLPDLFLSPALFLTQIFDHLKVE